MAKATYQQRFVQRVEEPKPEVATKTVEEPVKVGPSVPMPALQVLHKKTWGHACPFANQFLNRQLNQLHDVLRTPDSTHPQAVKRHPVAFAQFIHKYKDMRGSACATGADLGKRGIEDTVWEYLDGLAKQVNVDLKTVEDSVDEKRASQVAAVAAKCP